jgi:hypothetical protein
VEKTRNSKFEKLPDAFKTMISLIFQGYYSGSDIFICFGNIPIENILSVEFSGSSKLYGSLWICILTLGMRQYWK